MFFDEQDYISFLFRLGLALGTDQKELNKEKLTAMPHSRIRISKMGKDNFRLHAFCLMPNHFHLLIEQLGDIPISKLISKSCASYAKYINNKYKRVGHIFQDCFKAVLIEDNAQLMWISAYIHMNPVKDKLVMAPEKYRWSSYNDFVADRNLSMVTKKLLLEVFGNKKSLMKETLNFDVKVSL